MERCLLDTCTISDIIRPAAKRRPQIAATMRQYLRSFGQFTFSEISCFEILRGFRKAGAAGRIEQFREFCQHSELIPVNYEILDLAATLWAEGQSTGITTADVDLVIAATALHFSLPLATANVRHFDWIVGLNVQNWRE